MPADQAAIWRETLRIHPRGLLVNAAATLGAVVIAGLAAPSWVWIWAGIALSATLARWWICRQCLQHLPAADTPEPPLAAATVPQRDALLLVMGVWVAGLLWAVMAWRGIGEFKGSQQFAILVIVSALAGGATGSLASLRISGKVYILLMILPSCAQLVMLGTAEHLTLAVLGVIFSGVMASSHENNYQLLKRTVGLAHDKAGLVQALSEKAAAILQANAELEQRVQERTQALQHLAQHDHLTGLLNRRGLLEAAGPLLADQAHHSLSVVFIDLDRFKQINDGLGHDWGDLLLHAVAARLTQAAAACSQSLADSAGRRAHLVARWGGDEFIIVLLRPPAAELAPALERLRQALACPYDIQGRALSPGASLGVAERPQADGRQLAPLIMEASLAAAEAKLQGRGRVVLVSDSLLALQRRRADLIERLQTATTDASLHLVFQPIVAARDHQVLAYEALLRWHCTGLGDISPVEFIALAEESDQIGALGLWVLNEACRQAASWRAPLKVAVNTSIQQLVVADYATQVQAALVSHQLPPGRLVIEVTESVFDAAHLQQVLQSLLALRGLGVEIHLDDFGTGYSSLSRLQQFPIDAIKIDRSFVQSTDPRATAVIEAALLIARKFGLRVIAEGIETPQQASVLAGLGVDELQGYLFGRPARLASADATPTPRT